MRDDPTRTTTDRSAAQVAEAIWKQLPLAVLRAPRCMRRHRMVVLTDPWPGLLVEEAHVQGSEVDLEVVQKPGGLYELTVFGTRHGQRAILANRDELTLVDLDAALTSKDLLQ